MGWGAIKQFAQMVNVINVEQFTAVRRCSGGHTTMYVQVVRSGGSKTADMIVKVYDTRNPEDAAPVYSEVPYVDLRVPSGANNESMGFSFKSVPGFRIGIQLSANEALDPNVDIYVREG